MWSDCSINSFPAAMQVRISVEGKKERKKEGHFISSPANFQVNTIVFQF